MEADMIQPHQQRRKQAMTRYLADDKIEDICQQLACSKSWLYKWKARYRADDPTWAKDRSRKPKTLAAKTPHRIEQAVVEVRQSLARNGQSSSAKVIRQTLKQRGLEPLPAIRTIYRILQRHRQEGMLTEKD
jgi:transposase